MTRRTWLIVVALIHACGDETTKRNEPPQTDRPSALTQSVSRSHSEQSTSANVATATYQLDGQRIHLASSPESCWIAADSGASAARVPLDLKPPCYALRWQGEVDIPSPDVSDGVPVGQPGSLAAWHYTKPEPMTVFAVIGDPIPEDSGLRKSRQYKEVANRQPSCVSSIQGVVVKQGRLSAAKKLPHGRIGCPDTVEPQATFWILSHN